MKRWKYERPKWEKQRIREEKKEERKTGKKTKTKRGKKKTREEISRQNSFNRRRSCRQNNEVKNSTKKKDGKRRREKHKKEHEHNEEYEDKQDVEQAWKIRRSYWCWFVVNVNVFDIHCSPNSAQFSILLVAYIIRVIHWLTDINSKVFYLILCELYMYVLTSCWSCLMGHAFGVDNCNYWRYTNLYCYCFNE